MPVHGFLQCRQIGITLWPQYPDETFGPKRAAQAIRAGHRLIPMQLDAIQTGGAGGFLNETHVVGHEHAHAEHIPAVQRGGLFRRHCAGALRGEDEPAEVNSERGGTVQIRLFAHPADFDDQAVHCGSTGKYW